MKKDSPAYKEKEKEFQETAAWLVERMRTADEVSNAEVEVSYADMMRKMKKKQRRPLWHTLSGRAASIAAVFLLAVGLLWWQSVHDEESGRLSVALLDSPEAVEADEVTLIDGNLAINLKDSADIHYQTNGQANIEQFRLKQVARPGEPAVVAEAAQELNQMIVPKGRRATVTLSDGTKIYVNSGTKLIYPKVFDRKKREVVLEGEAYLAVAKSKDWPFVVRTKGFDVQVLGTEFNVFTRPSAAPSSVVLVEGSVEVTTPSREKVTLKPNQRIEMDGGETKVEEVDVLEYVSWKDNMLYLKDRKAKEVLDYLESHYGYRMKYGPDIASYSLTGKLDLQDDITDIMETLCLLLKVHYRVEGDAIYITK